MPSQQALRPTATQPDPERRKLVVMDAEIGRDWGLDSCRTDKVLATTVLRRRLLAMSAPTPQLPKQRPKKDEPNNTAL